MLRLLSNKKRVVNPMHEVNLERVDMMMEITCEKARECPDIKFANEFYKINVKRLVQTRNLILSRTVFL